MGQNRNLNEARIKKVNEFYTQFEDIERELQHYRKHFEGKVVYCNCDDPYVSNFFEFFAKEFENFGLKKLITTRYKSRQIDLFDENNDEKAIKLEYFGDKDGDGLPSIDETKITLLKGNGDFRSEECIELLKQADIVCTNPPFSLFREYIGQLINYEKKFLIVGPDNAITYKEVFPMIRKNKVWLGYGRVKKFEVKGDNGKAYFCTREEKWFQKFGNVGWFTNLDHDKRHESFTLKKKYSPDEYPHYDNYDAIEVSEVKNIPKNWEGYMGVPISFLSKHNPEQFEIVGTTEVANYRVGYKEGVTKFRGGGSCWKTGVQKTFDKADKSPIIGEIKGKKTYRRILIKFKKLKNE